MARPLHILYRGSFKLETFELVSDALVQLFIFIWNLDLFSGGPEIRGPCQQLLTLLTLKSATDNPKPPV